MDMVIINDEEELKFLTTHDELGIRGYVAAHDFYNEKKLTWVNEKEGESGISNQATVKKRAWVLVYPPSLVGI